MIITKEFEVEMSHVVRNCSTERCKKSIHGHSAKIKVSLQADSLDAAQMVYDFGLMKGSIKQFIDSFDHCHLMWSEDNNEYKNACKRFSSRWIELPFNPSAEMLSLFFASAIDSIIRATCMMNGEGRVSVHSVQYYETRTGSATSFDADVALMMPDIFNFYEGQVTFSPEVMRDWSEDLREWYEAGIEYKSSPIVTYFKNPKVEKQV